MRLPKPSKQEIQKNPDSKEIAKKKNKRSADSKETAENKNKPAHKEKSKISFKKKRSSVEGFERSNGRTVERV